MADTNNSVTTERNITMKALAVDPKKALDAARAALIAKLAGKVPADDAEEKAKAAYAEKLAAAEASDDMTGLRIPMAVIFGFVTGVKDELRQTGEISSVLLGTFEGVNAVSGKRIRAARAYIPDVQETIEADFRSMPHGVRAHRMKVRADIYAVPADNRYGYRYSVELPLRDTNVDPLADMRKEFEAADGAADGASKDPFAKVLSSK